MSAHVEPDDATPVSVLFIGGVGRSGSTLVERLADQVPGVHAIGETHHLWERGIQDNQLCGCGQPFDACPTWIAIGEAAFGGWDQLDLDRVIYLRHAVDRTRRVPELLKPGSKRADIVEYCDILSRYYRGVRDVTGADLIVDSAKNLSTAALLRLVPGIDLRIAHVVRDSRGVAYSWTKKVKRPEVDGSAGTAEAEFMPEYHPAYPAFRWLTDNGGFEVLARLGTPMVQHRYEDFLERPREILGEMLASTPAADADLSFIDGDTASLDGPVHSVSGNPMRFQTGDLVLRLDDKWARELDTGLQRLVTAMTFPLLARYNYPLRGHPASGSSSAPSTSTPTPSTSTPSTSTAAPPATNGASTNG